MRTSTQRRSVPWLCAFGVAILALGCLGRSPQTAYYRLDSTALGGTPVASRPELGIAVGALEFPRYLEKREIQTRDSGNGLVPASGQRWGAPLRSEVQRVFADNLAALLGTSRIAVDPVAARFPIAWRVLLDVRSFEGTRGRGVLLRVRWTVASGADGRAVVVDQSVVEQASSGDSWDAYVEAHSAALGVVSRQIAERIAALEAP